ncbi:hypothetical protein BDV18DRAFT_147491 [Aspergillus unguis]
MDCSSVVALSGSLIFLLLRFRGARLESKGRLGYSVRRQAYSVVSREVVKRLHHGYICGSSHACALHRTKSHIRTLELRIDGLGKSEYGGDGSGSLSATQLGLSQVLRSGTFNLFSSLVTGPRRLVMADSTLQASILHFTWAVGNVQNLVRGARRMVVIAEVSAHFSPV